jgi:hypothetical protein
MGNTTLPSCRPFLPPATTDTLYLQALYMRSTSSEHCLEIPESHKTRMPTTIYTISMRVCLCVITFLKHTVLLYPSAEMCNCNFCHTFAFAMGVCIRHVALHLCPAPKNAQSTIEIPSSEFTFSANYVNAPSEQPICKV